MADGSCVALDPYGSEAALRPDKGAAGWFFDEMVRWGQTEDSAENRARALAAYQQDLLPGQETEVTRGPGGFFDKP